MANLRYIEFGERRRLTVAEAEALYESFGYLKGEWEALKAEMLPGDEIWEFCTSKDTWTDCMGLQGIELRRDGKIVDGLITLIS